MPKFQFWLPTEGNLTRVQRRAIDSSEPIFLSGVPGTGKTVVSIKRLQNTSSSGKKGIIFTYGKLLRKTIEENQMIAMLKKYIEYEKNSRVFFNPDDLLFLNKSLNFRT